VLIAPRPFQNTDVVLEALALTKNRQRAVVNHEKLSHGLIDLAQIWRRVWTRDTRAATNVHGQGVKGQGHSVTQRGKNSLNYLSRGLFHFAQLYYRL